MQMPVQIDLRGADRPAAVDAAQCDEMWGLLRFGGGIRCWRAATAPRQQ